MFFLKEEFGSFSENDIEYLYTGDKEAGGMLSYCSKKKNFSGELKKVSFICLANLLEIIENSENRNFEKVFYDVDADYYKKLALNLHVLDSEERKQIAFEIGKKIKVILEEPQTLSGCRGVYSLE